MPTRTLFGGHTSGASTGGQGAIRAKMKEAVSHQPTLMGIYQFIRNIHCVCCSALPEVEPHLLSKLFDKEFDQE